MLDHRSCLCYWLIPGRSGVGKGRHKMYGMIVMMGMCEAPVPWFDVTFMAKTKYQFVPPNQH